MGAFRYQAINTNGKLVKGTLEGDTEKQIRSQLRQQQLKPLSVEKVSAGTSVPTKKNASQASFSFGLVGGHSIIRLKVKDLSLLTRQLASLVQSGMPLAESLQAVAKQTRKEQVRDIVLHVRSRVLEGLSLAQALSDYPRVFDSMYCAMVNAAEQAGFLGPVLDCLAEYTETSHEARQRLSSAMFYPLILVLVCIGIVIALMLLVVSQLISVFDRADQELFWATQFLIALSGFLQHYGLFLLLFLALVIWAFIWWKQQENNHKYWHRWLLKTPLISHVITQSDSTRFASTLSMLIGSGVPLLNSLRISNQTMNNSILREQAEQAAMDVEEGASLNRALDKAEVFPPLMVQMAASGEANGTLAEQLDYSARSQQRELDMQLSTILNMVEPLTIVVMGAVIGFIMMAIIVPIADMSNQF